MYLFFPTYDGRLPTFPDRFLFGNEPFDGYDAFARRGEPFRPAGDLAFDNGRRFIRGCGFRFQDRVKRPFVTIESRKALRQFFFHAIDRLSPIGSEHGTALGQRNSTARHTDHTGKMRGEREQNKRFFDANMTCNFRMVTLFPTSGFGSFGGAS